MYIGQVCICICVYITYTYQKLEFKQHSDADFVWALEISFPNSCHTSENHRPIVLAESADTKVSAAVKALT